MRLLLVEDEQPIITFLRSCLEAECFVVDVATDGEQGSFLGRTNDYDIIILDNRLPKKIGKLVCQDIRAARKSVPILMLSVVNESMTKTELLNLGADDYLTKPFALPELLARVRALLRRPRTIEPELLQLGDITLNTRAHVVKKKDKDVPLTKKEFILLRYLMKNCGTALTRAMIMEHVWDMNADPFSNTIESHVASLRKKIDPRGQFISTVSGIGYKMMKH